jgi:RecB family exonuclease
LHALRDGDVLAEWEPVLDTPGFHVALARTMAELRHGQVSADAIDETGSALGIALGHYEKELADVRLVDFPGLVEMAIHAISDARFEHPLLDKPTLVVDVELTSSLEADLLAALLRRSKDGLVLVPVGDERTPRLLAERLELEDQSLETEEPRTALDRLRRQLFGRGKPTVSEGDASLTVFSAPGESRECVEIARRIQLASRNGIPFDQMAVLLRAPGDYRPHLQEAFKRAGVPAHYSRGVRRPDPTGRAFLVLLRCRLEDYSAERFAEYLSIGQVPDLGPEGTPPKPMSEQDRWVAPDDETLRGVEGERPGTEEPTPEDQPPSPSETDSLREEPSTAGGLRVPRRWEKLLVEAAVIGGIDRWTRRLEGLAHEFELGLKGLDEPSGPVEQRLKRKLQELENLRVYSLPLLKDLAGLPSESAWEEWLTRLANLATRSLRQPDRILKVLADLGPLGPIGPVGLDEVIRVLRPYLLDLSERPSRYRYGRVFVAPIEAARGFAFQIVFLPGMAERLFPQRILEDPLLPDTDRTSINDALESNLVVNRDRILSERLALRLAAGAARDALFLSYPRLDLVNSRPRVPSFYSLESIRAAEGQLPAHGELAARAERVTQVRVGWPAPEKAESAIDEAEFDLATLKALQTAESAQALGAARYLLTANPHLARALRFRAQRWQRTWTGADGLLASFDEARSALAKHRLASRPYSATSLQEFSVCPYKFFLSSIQGLEPRETAVQVEELDPLQRGGLIHEAQFRLFSRLSDASLLPVSAETLEPALDMLSDVLDEVAREYEDDLAPAIPCVWQDGITSIRSDLREWLYRVSQQETSFIPWRFELGFGLPAHVAQDPDSQADPVSLDGDLLVRGKIDLVERSAERKLRVTDHKTGKPRFLSTAVIDGGETLQPVLYALVAEKLFPDHTVVSGRLSFCTAAGGFEEREVPLNERARGAMQTVTMLIDEAIQNTCLLALPKKGACGWCDFQAICGPLEEIRTARKPALPRLDELRGMK